MNILFDRGPHTGYPSAMTRNEKAILFIFALYSFSASVSSVFVSMYLFRFLDSIAELTVFNIFQFALMPLGFYIGGHAARILGKRTVLIAGLSLFLVYYGLLVVLGEASARYLVPLGAANGLANGFFWFSFNLFIVDSHRADGRGGFFGAFGALGSIAGAIAPAASTFLLGVFPRIETGYSVLFLVILFITLAMILAAFFLSSTDSGQRFTVVDKLRPGREPGWRFALAANLLYGLRDGASWSILSVLVLKAAGGDLLAGRLSFLFAVVGALAHALGGLILTERRGVLLWGWGSVGAVLSALLLIAVPTPLGALAAGTIWRAAEAAITLPFMVAFFNVLKYYGSREGNLAGRNIAVEIVLNLGRTLGAAAFLGLSFLTPHYVEILFPLVTLAFPGTFLVYRTYLRRTVQRQRPA